MSINNGAKKFMKELIIKDNIEKYLSVSKYINWKDNSILSKADEFKLKYADEVFLIKVIYEFVRDEIKHSWDVQDKRVTKSATEVLEQGVGICWAKANLLAALLRACGILAVICYQRLTLGDAKHDILNTFSSGQLSGFVLSFLFAMNKQYIKASSDDIGFILIDDPVQTMDDINISSLIEVLRNDFSDKQIILSTHEMDKENYILYKFYKYNRIGQSFNVKEEIYG